MKSLDGRNNIKIYNLIAGKTIPNWLSKTKRRKLEKRDVDIRRRIELIQDFDMPDISNCIDISPNGQYILATGVYKPRFKCFEVSALSLKFERCFDAEVVAFDILSEDYSKVIFLQEDRFIEFHNQGGRWFRTRIPKYGRDVACHYPSCDLYIAASGSEVYRLNLQQGQFLNPLQVNSIGVNKCLFNPIHYLFTCGTEDGQIEAWDPRSRHRVGVLDCALHMIKENVQIPAYKSAKDYAITALAYDDALTLGVGTHTGQVLIYDIRSSKPVLTKDHMDGFPIKNLQFHSAHSNNDFVFSLSSNALKIWHKDTGKPYTSIESDVKFNDMCAVKGSGMIFLATESPKMHIYFLPSLGPSPKWCAHLDALIEELEEEDAPAAYDDYKFVTEKELVQLGLDSLIGTDVLRAVMHGYYLDIRLYKKARQVSNVLDKGHLLKKKMKQKIDQQNERKIVPSDKVQNAIPNINRDSFLALKREVQRNKGDKSEIANELLQDSRFGAMFDKSEFDVDKETEIYSLIQPLGKRSEIKYTQMEFDTDDEKKRKGAHATEDKGEDSSSSEDDSDSIVSSDSEKEKEKEEISLPEKREQKRKPRNERQSDKMSKISLPSSTKNFDFVSGDTFEELKADWKHKKAMSMADRLRNEVEDDEDKVKDVFRGGRNLEFTLKDPSQEKLEQRRQQLWEHHQERKRGVRRMKMWGGKFK